MSRVLNYVPRVAIFLAGVAAAALTMPRRERGGSGVDPAAMDDVKKALTGLESRMESRELAASARFGQIEATLQEHTAKLADVPSTSQIVAAMEPLISKTMV